MYLKLMPKGKKTIRQKAWSIFERYCQIRFGRIPTWSANGYDLEPYPFDTPKDIYTYYQRKINRYAKAENRKCLIT